MGATTVWGEKAYVWAGTGGDRAIYAVFESYRDANVASKEVRECRIIGTAEQVMQFALRGAADAAGGMLRGPHGATDAITYIRRYRRLVAEATPTLAAQTFTVWAAKDAEKICESALRGTTKARTWLEQGEVTLHAGADNAAIASIFGGDKRLPVYRFVSESNERWWAREIASTKVSDGWLSARHTAALPDVAMYRLDDPSKRSPSQINSAWCMSVLSFGDRVMIGDANHEWEFIAQLIAGNGEIDVRDAERHIALYRAISEASEAALLHDSARITASRPDGVSRWAQEVFNDVRDAVCDAADFVESDTTGAIAFSAKTVRSLTRRDGSNPLWNALRYMNNARLHLDVSVAGNATATRPCRTMAA